MGPANYASQRKEGVRTQSTVVDTGLSEEMFSVNVIDSDQAPSVTLQSEVESCGEERQT